MDALDMLDPAFTLWSAGCGQPQTVCAIGSTAPAYPLPTRCPHSRPPIPVEEEERRSVVAFMTGERMEETSIEPVTTTVS